MTVITNKKERQIRRHARVRARVRGTAERPRLAVFRSGKHIYAQIIDDVAARTLVAASDLGGKQAKSLPTAKSVGEALAKAALAKKIKLVAFDRGGYIYAGRIRELAEGARAGGLEF